MAEMQGKLLARAADWVKPGGTLVYATCSLEPAEGERRLAAFLESRSDYALVAPAAAVLPEGVTADPGGWLRTGPTMLADRGRMDGFFIAQLTRTLSSGSGVR
jgi:16S rRNA (cytosine967-C5)-methyltransferase